MPQWSSLHNSRTGDIVSVREPRVLALEDGVYKISDDQYILADAFLDEGNEKHRLVSVYWASSEPGFRRAYSMDIENDDLAVRPPPTELLPVGADGTYAQIKNALAEGSYMECASYRVMTDGAFIHKSLDSASASYYFRSPEILSDELPFAIVWKCFSG